MYAMKKSTLVFLVMFAMFISLGWLLYDTIALIPMLSIGGLCALGALITVLRKENK